MTKTKQATPKQLIRLLYDNNYTVFLGEIDERNSEETINYLRYLNDQDYIFNYAIHDRCLFIWD